MGKTKPAVTVYVTAEEKEQLETIAAEHDTSINKVVARLIRSRLRMRFGKDIPDKAVKAK